MSKTHFECKLSEAQGYAQRIQALLNCETHQNVSQAAIDNFDEFQDAAKEYWEGFDKIRRKYMEYTEDGKSPLLDQGEPVYKEGQTEEAMLKELEEWGETDADITLKMVDAGRFLWGYPGLKASGAVLHDARFMFINFRSGDDGLTRKERRAKRLAEEKEERKEKRAAKAKAKADA